MRLEILSGKEIKRIHHRLKERFGFDQKLDYGFLKSGRGREGRIWICPREVGQIRLKDLHVETVGLYFCYREKTRLRLSIEGAQLIGKHVKKNVVKITEDQAEKWIRGFNLKVKGKLTNGYVILKLEEDVIGCGKYRDGKILNIVRKSRRIKKL